MPAATSSDFNLDFFRSLRTQTEQRGVGARENEPSAQTMTITRSAASDRPTPVAFSGPAKLHGTRPSQPAFRRSC